MSSIFVLDASGPRACAAWVRDGRVLAEESVPTGRGQGGGLFLMIERLVATASDLTEIRVGIGPGSYAGCRQAIALADGLALARAIPLGGVCSYLALEPPGAHCVILGDARRGWLYAARMREGVLVEGPVLIEAGTAPAWAGPQVLLARFAHESEAVPGEACPMRVERLASAPLFSPPEPGPPEPLYLRPPNITIPKHRVTLLD